MKKLLLILFLIPALCGAQMKYTDGHFNTAGNYRVYEPTHFKPVGIILYFHGLGERSDTDLSLIERNEIPKLFKNGIEKPFIVICPQLSTSKNGWGNGEIVPMLNLMDAYARFYKVDKHVTGHVYKNLSRNLRSNSRHKRGLQNFKDAAVCGR